MKFTFKELLEKYNVVIPQLQRDYAQGRTSEEDLRKVFISNIRSVLADDGTDLNLDFVYGYTEPSGGEREVFIPLDGQQRLTTLWLIHWYLSPREVEQIEEKTFCFLDSDTVEYLKNFTYQTRISSKRFCTCLISESLNLKSERSLSSNITDSPWYMASWDSDPTIKSMLAMLDTLEKLILDKEISWSNLLTGRITFDYIDIKSDEFRLTDELYIKMNSRGKPLTDFENFKALFSGILAKKDTEYAESRKNFENAQVSYQDYFAFKIDGQWLDLFWSYRNQVTISVDKCILNFLYFVSEFLFYRSDEDYGSEGIVPKRDIDFYAEVFSSKKNIDFLFDSLDFLSKLESAPEFFNDLFENISTFDIHKKDYFFRCITSTGFDVLDKTMLYSILSYATKLETVIPDDEFRDYVRVVRNLLMAVRQPNPKRRIEYLTNLRLPNVTDYCAFIDRFTDVLRDDPQNSVYGILSETQFSGFSKESITAEMRKALVINDDLSLKDSIHALEEHKQIQGNTINFNFKGIDVKNKIESFLQIWSGETDRGLLVRAFLTYGDYSVKTHQRTLLGPVWYLGSRLNWNRILTAGERDERRKISVMLDDFLEGFIKAEGINVSEKLEFIIDRFQSEEYDWRYYFITYPAITSNHYEKLNVFSWGDSDFEVNQLGNSGKQVLHSYHLNSYEIALKSLFKEDGSVVLYYGRFTDLSYIKVLGKISIRCKASAWKISWQDSVILDDSLIEKYRLVIDGNTTYLRDNEMKDRIELAARFIKDFVEL